MKFLIATLLSIFVLFSYNNSSAQDEPQMENKSEAEEPVPEDEELDPLRFYKAKYDATFKAPMDIVAEAVEKAIEGIDCVIVQNVMKTNEDGWLKSIIKSDYCVFVEGDSTFDLLRLNSYEMPFIRGGAWKNGRMQYKFIVTEQPDETCYRLLKGNLSGFEHYVTNRVHFWVTNGIFEHDMLTAIERKIQELMKK